MKENKIFNTKKIDDANRRIAFQIYESNINLKEIYLVGISSNGTVLSKRIGDYLNKISDLKVHQVELKIDKKNPRNKIDISINIQKLKNSFFF